MSQLIHLFICSTTFVIVAANAKGNCSIRLSDDIKGFAPVILTSTTGNGYKLFKPAGKVTYLKRDTKLMLVCTGNKNVFANTTYDTLRLKCSSGKFVDSNNNNQPLKELVCKSIPTSSMKITNDKCSHGGKGYIYEIGFIIRDQFYGPVFEICYNNVTENTVYTRSILNGAAISYPVTEPFRRSFAADGMQYSTSKTNMLYTKKSQIKRFENYFGAAQTYVEAKNFLARGHLVADADFIFAYEQLSTYYYVNTAPEFQAINAGNWLRVEKLARAVAASYKDDIESYNTYMGTLALSNNNGNLVEIYLDDMQKIEVPKYFVKILLHRTSDSAIVFVTVNNPYILNDQTEQICANVCEKSGFVNANFHDLTKGYTFCCELNEFKLLMDSLPDEVKGSNLLKHKI